MVLDDLDCIVAEVKRFAKAGGDTIVDLTNTGIKRDLEKISGIKFEEMWIGQRETIEATQ